jgi:uroporphyrinogen decarboxylase
MSPYYNDLVGFLRNELGVPIVNVDTDGDCLLLVPEFVEAGVNMILPWEVQAGMDVVAVREQWPTQFVINGGIDKRALYADRAAIEAEIMRVVPPMLEKGGYIPALDHLVPPEVPLENYRYFLELVREVGVKACSGAA